MQAHRLLADCETTHSTPRHRRASAGACCWAPPVVQQPGHLSIGEAHRLGNRMCVRSHVGPPPLPRRSADRHCRGRILNPTPRARRAQARCCSCGNRTRTAYRSLGGALTRHDVSTSMARQLPTAGGAPWLTKTLTASSARGASGMGARRRALRFCSAAQSTILNSARTRRFYY